MSKKYIVSACLLGVKCRYDGTDSKSESVVKLFLTGNAMAVCPEILGGQETPREPAELVTLNSERVVLDKSNRDLTAEFEIGARAALSIARIFSADTAILKSNSPSCGCRKIYDGNFSGNLIDGEGITADLFRRNGIKVFNEVEWNNEPNRN